MTPSILILRPNDSARETAQRAALLGLTSIIDPLFVVEPLKWSAPPAQEFDALMLTSANAVTFGGKALDAYKTLPVLAVGSATAAAAEQAGFNVAVTGDRGADDLLRSLADDQYSRILRLTGKDHVRLAPSGRRIALQQVYQARALTLGDTAQAALRKGHVVLLYSVRAARILSDEMERVGLDRSVNHIVALSANIAAAAGEGWKSIQTAEEPTDDALLSLAGRLCLDKEIGKGEAPTNSI
ncbi:uroporphyrinogen-III synthase [Sphingorhabdus sp. Alg231-15]|uniref:uroporphyrinogen-III synthase n=1 Tax=Sphingorhabdus sp. Alg231-15 TaxID=1922222 RepID=UPI000D556BF7